MSWWRKPGGFRASLLIWLAGFLAQKGVEAAVNAFRRRKREKTNKALESKIDEDFQDLKNKMEALQERFKNLQSKQSEEIRAELEKIPEEEIAMILKSKLRMNLRELSQRIQTLEGDLKEWPESTRDELQLLRAALKKIPGNEEEEISRALESMLKNRGQTSLKFRIWEEDGKERLEDTKDGPRLRRP